MTNKKVKKQKKTKKAKNGEKVETKLVQDLANRLLELMSTQAVAEVGIDEENDAVTVNVKSEDEAGLLIGNRGATLNSLQIILGMMLQRQLGEWKRIMVNVADWREREKERLVQLAQQAAERAKSTGQSQSLYNLSSSQRRIVHLSLSENKYIETESVGEGRDRYLVVSPKK